MAVALGLVVLAFLLSCKFVHLPQKVGGNFAWVVPALLVGVTVQSFHMVEHVLQVVRVFGLGAPSRGGLLGPMVDSEWVHFTYNAAVLIGLLVIVGAPARGMDQVRRHSLRRLPPRKERPRSRAGTSWSTASASPSTWSPAIR